MQNEGAPTELYQKPETFRGTKWGLAEFFKDKKNYTRLNQATSSRRATNWAYRGKLSCQSLNQIIANGAR